MLNEHFHADVVYARHEEEALEKLRGEQFSLVMVNRIFHRNGEHGLDVIRHLKSEPDLAATPVMLLSNHENYQQERRLRWARSRVSARSSSIRRR